MLQSTSTTKHIQYLEKCRYIKTSEVDELEVSADLGKVGEPAALGKFPTPCTSAKAEKRGPSRLLLPCLMRVTLVLTANSETLP